MKSLTQILNEAIWTSKNNKMMSHGADSDTVLDLIKSIKNNGWFEWEIRPGKIEKVGASKESLDRIFSNRLLDPEVLEYLIKNLEKNEGKDWKFETDRDIKGRDLVSYEEFIQSL